LRPVPWPRNSDATAIFDSSQAPVPSGASATHDRSAVEFGDQDRSAGVDVGSDRVVELPVVAFLKDEGPRDPLVIEGAKRRGISSVFQHPNRHAVAVGHQGQIASIPPAIGRRLQALRGIRVVAYLCRGPAVKCGRVGVVVVSGCGLCGGGGRARGRPGLSRCSTLWSAT
jgi:hypothetical protein